MPCKFSFDFFSFYSVELCFPLLSGREPQNPERRAGHIRARTSFDIFADTWHINHPYKLALSMAYIMKHGPVKRLDLRNT